MNTQVLLIVSIVVVLIVLIALYMASKQSRKYYKTRDSAEDAFNMNRRNLNGERMSPQTLPPVGGIDSKYFMNARYKVIADENVGDNIDPLNDLCIAGFKNPIFDHGKEGELPKISTVNWYSEKSTPVIEPDNKNLYHVAADLTTPEYRAKITGKTNKFLPFTVGRSRLNFSSFENSTSEPAFRQ
jgi:hypothetical protein